MSLDPNKVTNTPEEMIRQAHLMSLMAPESPADGVPSEGDMTGAGGGNIGVGGVPLPGEAQFTGEGQSPVGAPPQPPPPQPIQQQEPMNAGMPPGMLQ